MGARGKKRRRADGGIADGRKTPRGAPPPGGYETMEAVSPAALAAAIDISSRYLSFDRKQSIEKADWFTLNEEIYAIAGADQDGESLATRSEKLVDFLRKPGNDKFISAVGDSIEVDPALLEWAATMPTDNSTDGLRWPKT